MRACSGVATWLLLSTLAAPALAEPEPPEPRWWAAVGLDAGALLHRFEGSVVSSAIANAPIDNPQPIRPPDADESSYAAPFVSGSLELVGPRALGVRPFFSATAGGEFGVERDIAKERTTGPFGVSDGFPGSTRDTADVENLVRGQGSRTRIETANLFLGASAGAAFALSVRGQTVRVKPSLRYLWEEVEARGTVQRAVLLEDANANPPSGLEDFRLITLRDEKTEAFHALGPGLELEVDLSRKESWVMSVFASGGLDFFVGDRVLEFTARNAIGETATFRVERDAVSYRAGIGLRLRFER